MPIIGELICKASQADYTEPENRGSDAAKFRVDIRQRGGTTLPTLNIEIQNRNLNDDTWATLDSFAAITSTGVKEKSVASSVKELVRYKLSFSAGSADSFVRFVPLQTVWT
jgi:hypothetical protein